MKEKIRNTIKHPHDESREITIVLDPTTIIAEPLALPVTWKGTVDQHEIEVIQKGLYAGDDNIEFKQFPEPEYSFLKTDIIKWMDGILRRYN